MQGAKFMQQLSKSVVLRTKLRDFSCIRLKCSIFGPRSASLTSSSNSCLLPDPLSQLGDARVHTRLVPTTAALAPAHDAGLEPLPTLLETRQGPTGVSLVIGSEDGEEWLSDWVWMWEQDNYTGGKIHMCCKTHLHPPLGLENWNWLENVSPGRHRLLQPWIRCRASWRWVDPRWPHYTRCRWWFSPLPSAAVAPSHLREWDEGVSTPPHDLCVRHQHQRC